MRQRSTAILLALLGTTACGGGAGDPPGGEASLAELETELREMIAEMTGDSAEVSVAFKDLETGDSLLIDAREEMHAASTMKVPVMMRIYRMQDAGELTVDDSVTVRTEFTSMADGSAFTLGPDDDGDDEIFEYVGRRMPIRYLIERSITVSGNLATNLLIEIAEPDSIAAMQEELGAGEMRARRGVQDIAAFERGMNNTTTAYGYMKTLEAIADGRAASAESVREMLAVLRRQEIRDMIPAGLPSGTRVGNKTGSIGGIHHDGAIVHPDGRAPYVLVILTRGFEDDDVSAALGARISGRTRERVR